MHLLFEESGDLKIATSQSVSGIGDAESWQATTLSGKKIKLKAKEVWLRFENSDAHAVMSQANELSAGIDLQLLWDCAPDEEFGLVDVSQEYFGDQASIAQQVALGMALQGAPVFFRRKGRGRFQRAPLEQLQAGLAAIERKQKELEQQQVWQQDLISGQFPETLRSIAKQLLFNPDKNTNAYKALQAACVETGESAAQLMIRCGAIDSPLAFHQEMFLKTHFPHGAEHHDQTVIDQALCDTSFAELPVAQVKAFSIDDSGTTEIDDALSVTPLEGGGHRVGIHIAAPGLVITKDDPVDLVARHRMSTVYFPGDKMTMLPDSIIAQFSLDEGGERAALSMYVDLDEDGKLQQDTLEIRAERVPIVANLRLEDLERLVTEEALINQEVFPFHEELAILWKGAQHLHAARQERRVAYGLRLEQLGLVDPNALARDFYFEIEERAGEQFVEIVPRQRGSILDTVVAEWMIFCNSSAGRLLAEHGLPGLFRTQKGWGPLRTRMQTTHGPHEGLGLDYYAWSTSPLRRYSDLVNQWQLIALAKHGVTAKMVAPFSLKDASLMGIAADFETCYQAYGEFQDRLEKYWCLRWLQQQGLPKTVFVRHLKEGMSRLEAVPLHIAIPELATQPRMTRAEVEITDLDLLQLNASARVLHVESVPASVEAAPGLGGDDASAS